MIVTRAMVAADEYLHIAFGPVRVLSVIGFNNQGTDVYLQFHQKFPAALTAGDVPVFKSLWFPSGAQSTFGRDIFGPAGLNFSELTIATSTTEVNYTATVDAGLDLTIVYETVHNAQTITVVGDLTTAVGSLQVWAESAGPKTLYRLDVKNSAGFTQYALVQALDSGAITDKSCAGPLKCPTGTTSTFFFGRSGVKPLQNVADVSKQGCTIRKTNDFTAFNSGTNCNIRAVYI